MKVAVYLLLALNVFASEFSAQAEYLCWWFKDSLNPVAFTALFDVAPQFTQGLDIPFASVVIGQEPISTGTRSGARFSLGWKSEKIFGLNLGYFFFPNQKSSQSVASSGAMGSPFYIIPYFDVISGSQSAVDLSDPGIFAGYANLDVENGLQGAEALLSAQCYKSPAWTVHTLTGFKWLYFRESLHFLTSSPFISSPFDTFQTKDSFTARNHFYGAALGLSSQYSKRWFQIEGVGKVSLGCMQNFVNIEGQLTTSIFTSPTEPSTYEGGYFALPTNIGNFSQSNLSVIPEVNLNLFFDLSNWAALEIGYSFLYATNILYAAKSVDQNINPTQAPSITRTLPSQLSGESAPSPSFATAGFFAQGINIGLSFRY